MTGRQLPPWPDLRGRKHSDVIARREQACVGAVVFVYDQNHRVYAGTGPNAGRASERHFFVASRIEGETRVSWILDRFGAKIPKNDPARMFGRDDVEDELWRRIHSWRIADKIHAQDPATLRKIAELIGYTATDTEQA